MKSTSVQYMHDICVNNYQLKMKLLMYNFLIAVI